MKQLWILSPEEMNMINEGNFKFSIGDQQITFAAEFPKKKYGKKKEQVQGQGILPLAGPSWQQVKFKCTVDGCEHAPFKNVRARNRHITMDHAKKRSKKNLVVAA